jgi:DNA-directed RNA polymerase subunit RPC12/RpoP
MIRTNCVACGRKVKAEDKYAGKTVKCPNCGDRIVLPEPETLSPPPDRYGVSERSSARPEAMAQSGSNQIPPGQQGQAVIVQVQQQTPSQEGRIGPRKVSTLGLVFFGLIWPGAQYQWTRQWGKMCLFMTLTLFVNILVFITCGIGLVIAVPYSMFLLIDGLVVASRLRRESIHPWRFF